MAEQDKKREDKGVSWEKDNFLPPITEDGSSPRLRRQNRTISRPVSLSPRIERDPQWTPESSGDDDGYEDGLIGTTPPKAQRLSKTRRRSSKLRRTTSPYEYKDKQKSFSKTRPLSADIVLLDSIVDGSTPINSQPRRHTLSETPSKKTYGFSTYSSLDDGKSKKDKESVKKKKEKVRKQDRDEKRYQQKGQPLPLSLDNIPQLSIITEPPTPIRSVSDRTPADRHARHHPLLVSSLTSNELRVGNLVPHPESEEEGRPRVIRSHSDALLSLNLSSSQSIRCPSDRNKFYKNFRKTLTVLSKRQQQGLPITSAGFHVPRQHSENLSADNPFGHMVEEIWKELRAWQTQRTSEEQEDWDFDHHRDVESVLQNIMHYQFDTRDVLSSGLFTGTEREREEYEPLMSLRSSVLSKNGNGGNIGDEGINTSEENTPLSSLNHSSMRRHDKMEESQGGEEDDDDNDDTDEAPKTLTQQGSNDSDGSSSTISSKGSDEYSYEQFLNPQQISALSEVNQVLEKLENVESLYSNSRKLGDENPTYRQPLFRRRRDALILWVKVTKGLADHLTRLSKWFGVPIIIQPFISSVPSTPSQIISEMSHPLSGMSLSDLSSTDPESSLGGLSRLNSLLFSTQSSQLSSGSSKSNPSRPRTTSNVESTPSIWKGYRKFVDRTLKKKGLKWLIDELLLFVKHIFRIAEEALKDRAEEAEEGFTEEEVDEAGLDHVRESWPLLQQLPYTKFHQEATPQISRSSSNAPRCWMDEMSSMNLPSFGQLYLQLARVVLDIMQECMRQKTEVNKNIKPSAYSIKKLIQECHMTISKGVEVRSFFRQKAHMIMSSNPGRLELIDAQLSSYERDLKDMLQLYFSYVQQLVDVIGTYRELLEEEWAAAKEICVDISNGEVEAGLNFSHLASELIEKLQEDLKSHVDKCCDELHERSLQDTEDQKQLFIESCRSFKNVIQNARESAMKSLGFAKTLMKDLEIAANFCIRESPNELLQVLKSSDHVQVNIPQRKGCMLFVPQQIADKHLEIQELLHASFGRSHSYDHHPDSHPHSSPPRPGFGSPRICYLLVVRFAPHDSIPAWTGQTIDLIPSAENIVSICEMQVEGIKMIVRESQQLEECRNSFFGSVGNVVEIASDKTSSHQSVAERISDLKHVICRFGHSLVEVVDRVNSNLSVEEFSDRGDILDRYCSTMHTCYNFAFEYIKEVTRLLGEEFVHVKMGVELLNFAQHWMIFVNTRCERGYGKIPRWSAQGLEFLLLACSPRMLATMSHGRYESLKKQMDKCLEHLIGDDTTIRATGDPHASRLAFSPVGGVPNRPNTWQRPSGRRRSNVRTMSYHGGHHAHCSPIVQRKNEDILERIDGSSPPPSNDSITSSGIDSPTYFESGNPLEPSTFPNHVSATPPIERVDSTLFQYYNGIPDLAGTPSGSAPADWCDKADAKRKEIQEKCEKLDMEREKKLREQGIIGREKEGSTTTPLEYTKLTSIRQTHFNWRRGRKLGEGQFGKVYECVNLDKGEVNAVKMISLVDKTHNKVRDILSEIQVFLKINHSNIVRLYGVEIHHTELYIFMEYCNQGTLWSAVKQGLPEKMIRGYTRDILSAVDALHDKGIVHRDIKSANIFLSDDSIKLGDFGLSIQLRNLNKTAPQEIKDQRGTIPYMAPEVVLKHDMGRPMDIWSVACVVVEMFTSKHPWFEYADNQYAIMFQLGQGKAPAYPKDKGEELVEFLDMCFTSDPGERADTTDLMKHAFVQVDDDDED